MLDYVSGSAEETKIFAKKLAKMIKPKDVIAFRGGMGVGKTTFVNGLIKGLGIVADVASPTFALMNEYKGKDITAYHFDMYRVTNFDSLLSTGFFDFLEQDQSVLIIEWSENIQDELPENTIYITLKADVEDENKRNIKVEGDRF